MPTPLDDGIKAIANAASEQSEPLGPGDAEQPVEASLLGLVGLRESVWRRTFLWLYTAASVVIAVAILSELAVMTINMIERAFFNQSVTWSLEIAHLALSIIAFVGGAAAYRVDYHLTVRAVTRYLSPTVQVRLATAMEWLVLGVGIMIAWYSIPLVSIGWDQHTPILNLPVAFTLMPLTAGGALLALFAVERIAIRPWRSSVIAAVFILGLAAIAIGSQGFWQPFATGSALIGLGFVLLAVLIILGFSIGFALTLTAFVFTYAGSLTELTIVPRQMDDGIGSFVLLAIPFFVLAGLIMTAGGLGDRIADFVRSLLGHTPGGSLQSIVVAMYLFSGLSGSKLADMAAVGTTLARSAERDGYSRGETAAILTASAVMGETIPPSTILIVLGSISSLSIAALFAAGLVPAVVLAIGLMLVIFIRAKRAGLRPHDRFHLRLVGTTGLRATPALTLPAILIVGIVFGISTAVEVSAVAVIYGLLLSTLLYRQMTLAKLWHSIQDSATLTGMVLFVVSGASAFAWTLSFQQVPEALASLVAALGDNPVLFLVGSVVGLALLGMLLEGLPALIILVPILLPVAQQIGINPIQFGIVMIIAMSLGAFAPPIGIGVYGACLLVKATLEEVSKPLVVYWMILVVGLAVIAAVPAFTLTLPRLLHLGT